MSFNGTLTTELIDSLSIVYIAFLTPSVIGSFSVLVVSILRWQRLKTQVHLLVQLALADFLAAVILMSTSIMNKFDIDRRVLICRYSLPLSLTFYFISFLLVAVYAWKSKNAIQGWRERPADDEVGQSRCTKQIVALPVYLFVWLIPLVLYLIYVSTPLFQPAMVLPPPDRSRCFSDCASYCTSCILFLHVWKDPCSSGERIHDIFIRVFLLIVVIPVILSCSVIYYKIGKWYKRHEQATFFPVEGDGLSRRRFKKVISTARNMVMVILFCWTPALALILMFTLMLWIDIEQQTLFFLYIIQAVGVSIQGFLNSMVYAWRRPNFTEAVLGENTPLVAYNHQPFFDESLRSSF